MIPTALGDIPLEPVHKDGSIPATAANPDGQPVPAEAGFYFPFGSEPDTQYSVNEPLTSGLGKASILSGAASAASDIQSPSGVPPSTGNVDRALASAAELSAALGIPHPLFSIAQLGIDRRLLVNRKRQLQMYRVWMQGKFRKI